MIDPTLFGLQPETEVKFFTPDEAAKIPGVTSGYNAVYNISKTRVRYELLKAGKSQGGNFVPAAVIAAILEPVVEVKQEVIEQPVEQPVEDVKEPVVEVKQEQDTVEEKAAKKSKK